MWVSEGGSHTEREGEGERKQWWGSDTGPEYQCSMSERTQSCSAPKARRKSTRGHQHHEQPDLEMPVLHSLHKTNPLFHWHGSGRHHHTWPTGVIWLYMLNWNGEFVIIWEHAAALLASPWKTHFSMSDKNLKLFLFITDGGRVQTDASDFKKTRRTCLPQEKETRHLSWLNDIYSRCLLDTLKASHPFSPSLCRWPLPSFP